MGDTGICVHDA